MPDHPGFSIRVPAFPLAIRNIANKLARIAERARLIPAVPVSVKLILFKIGVDLGNAIIMVTHQIIFNQLLGCWLGFYRGMAQQGHTQTDHYRDNV